MASNTDALLARFEGELERRQSFMDGIVEAAGKEGRDLTDQEMELLTSTRDRMGELTAQLVPLQEAARITAESRRRSEELAPIMHRAREESARPVEYRSAGEYLIDLVHARTGDRQAAERLAVYNRAAAHQTTGDNPGLIPTPILGPVISFIDSSRPMATFLGPRQLPSGSWTRPKVTQHTAVAAQATEKSELTSQKMTITKQTVTAATYGGYVNVSRQDIDWTVPSIMQIVVDDLAAQYAIKTEDVLADAVLAGATAGQTIPTGAATAAALAGAVWDAAARVYSAMQGQGRLAMFVAPDMAALWGPVFPPVNPQNAQSPGFQASDLGAGLIGQVGGIPVYMTNGLNAGGMVVLSSAAVEVYEDRLGSLSVVEPSVLGVQVAYAGYFTWLIVDAGGVVKIVKTP